MARLLLSSIVTDPTLGCAVTALELLGISTAVELLFAPAIPPHADLSSPTLAALRCLASVHLAAPRTSGANLLAKRRLAAARSTDQFLTTSIDELDVLLGGGWRPGSVVEVAGPKGGGKSLLVLYSVLSCLILHEDARVTWIDTEGAFDAHRCLAVTKQLLADLRESAGISFTDGEGRFDDQAKGIEVMDRLGVSRLGKSGAAVDAIVSELLGNAPDEHAPPITRLVVIDSLVPLLGGDALTSPSAQGHAHLVAVMRRLTALARSPTQPLVIFVINSATPTPLVDHPAPISRLPTPQSLKPSLGNTFTYMTDITLWLTRADLIWGESDHQRGVIELARNRFGESRGWTAFVTDGIVLRGLV